MFENQQLRAERQSEASYGVGQGIIGKSATKREATIRETLDERISALNREIKKLEELRRGMSEDLLGMPNSYLRGLY